ncbi:MAG TPA: sporulation protein [Candidatus Stackebrandtia excrementipullorum]|nr:sporulation protein [Candidatus Stackebrandtia excrementipullorum]
MVLRKLTAALAAGVTVDTVLNDASAVAGGTVSGEVLLTGGRTDHRVQHIALDLQVVADNSDSGEQSFHRHLMATDLSLETESVHALPFRFDLPADTPVNGFATESVPGVRIGVVTELALERAFDKGDLDPLTIQPLPAQAAVLTAADALGFAFHRSLIVSRGLPTSTLPFRQKFEYWPTGEFAKAFTVMRLAFHCTTDAAEVYVEAEKTEGDASTGGRAGTHMRLRHDEDNAVDVLREELRNLAERPGLFRR